MWQCRALLTRMVNNHVITRGYRPTSKGRARKVKGRAKMVNKRLVETGHSGFVQELAIIYYMCHTFNIDGQAVRSRPTVQIPTVSQSRVVAGTAGVNRLMFLA